MLGTMQTSPLTVGRMLAHASERHASGAFVTLDDDFRSQAHRFDVFGGRCAALAHALDALGVGDGDVVGVLAGNVVETLEVLVGAPARGAVAHPINVRLPLSGVLSATRRSRDVVLVADPRWCELVAEITAGVDTVRHVVFLGAELPKCTLPERVTAHAYESLLDGLPSRYDWPEVDENSAAVVAYTSGTTGEPKGVAYSHRSLWLHSMELGMAESAALNSGDRVLVTVPLFHVMSWGLPYAALISGASMVFARARMPEPLPDGADVAALLREHRPNKAATTPVVWLGLYRHLEDHPQDLGHLEEVMVGGSAVPPALVDAFTAMFGVQVLQAFGMTETSPLVTVARPDPRSSATRRREQLLSQGRFPAAVESRIVDAGRVMPHDGSSLGELQLRGPWVTTSYLGLDRDERHFDGEWLRTGEVAAITSDGYLRVADRLDDIILSGGEWISSVELENAVMLDEDVAEAACVGVPDERWGHRPLVLVVRKPGSTVTAHTLWSRLADTVEEWKRPDHWAFVDRVPRTTVGKFDKRGIRARYAEGGYEVTTIHPRRERRS